VRIGAVTIGQAPRDDVVPELQSHIGPGVAVVQRGALDGLSLEQIRDHSPESGEQTLVSRLRDGSEVEIDRRLAVTRVQSSIDKLQTGARLILLLCTASFEELESNVPLLRPAEILDRIVGSMEVRRLGVFTPSLEQIPTQRQRWRGLASEEVVVVAASPYLDPRGVADAAAELVDREVDAVVMDCIGYTEAMKARLLGTMAIPVVTAVGALGREAAAMLGRKAN